MCVCGGGGGGGGEGREWGLKSHCNLMYGKKQNTRIPRNAVSRLPALFHKIKVNL